MTCVIVDDNAMARATLAQLASLVNDLVVLAECSSAVDAYNFLRNQSADILLLDIEMPEMSGLELTKHLGSDKPIIIFTTSKKDYAVEAFELSVADYLVKPVTPARFLLALDKARQLCAHAGAATRSQQDEFIFVRDGHIVRKLQLNEILFAEAMGDFVKFHTRQKQYLIHIKFKTAEERLPPDKFFRVHRSFLVALDKVDCLQDGGIMIDGRFIPLSDSCRKEFNKRINVI